LADKLLAEVFSRLMEESLTVEQADAIVLRYGIDVVSFDEGLGPIDIQDSHWESVLIHCASDQLIRSAAHGEAVRAQ
jgi:hypothetical protein